MQATANKIVLLVGEGLYLTDEESEIELAQMPAVAANFSALNNGKYSLVSNDIV